jgi:hypothetical protein
MAYDNLDNAAAAALWMLALEQDAQHEHMGALYASGQGFDRTPTISSGGSEHVRGALTLPQKGSLRGLFHNHPGPERSSEGFSEDDKAQARRLKVPSYISTPSGAWRKFDPIANKTTEVLAEFPIEEHRRYLMAKILGRGPDDPRGVMRDMTP